ncbi:SGNH/GDSL hydrolase family protein [Sphingomonas mesophila]|uniref:SGNH/GDSL hydrolase family protein n=1 Tax=Sphingomonas mesophila TaxID=2303576 RepID=UPI000E58FDE8|nr:SGNH/GDSL hydrolase family protein [Sphingomonas mesophila]
MAYGGVYVFGDSLIDAGNALKLAQFYGNLTFSDLPDGAPAASDGYFQGRFSDGYTFADLLSNKAVGKPTTTIFPYGYEWNGVEIAPWTTDPKGNNLNFGYGGAQVRQGGEKVPDLDGQTDAFRDAVDGDAPGDALYIVTMGGNDVRALAKPDRAPASEAEAYAALDEVAQQLTHELGQLIEDGARHFVITGIADVGRIPAYDADGIAGLSPLEQQRADAATLYSVYLDTLIRTEVVPALDARGATVTYVPMMDYQSDGTTVTGGLNAILPTLEGLYGVAPGTLTTDLLGYKELVFFDQVHPTAQVHALFGSYAQALLSGTSWVETLPIAAADVDFSMSGSIAVAGEVDQLVVAAVAGTTYRFDLLGMSSLGTPGSLGDPTLAILSGGVGIANNADDGAGFDATVTFRAATSGNVTVQMSAVGTLTGSYQLIAAVVEGAAALGGNVYVVSNAATVVIEGAGGIGRDIVQAATSYALAANSEIEELATTNARGKGAINLTGNDFGQALVGNAGSNVLEGKGGADVLTGGAGNDVFVLGPIAAAGPGKADTITDYAKGDVVDVSQALAVAAGTNVAAGGYLRVTTGGLIQVDANGGGDQWTTLATVGGSGSVSLRYASGGTLVTTSLARIVAPSAMAMTGAVAGAGTAVVTADGGALGTPAMPSAQALTFGSDQLGAATLGLIAATPQIFERGFVDSGGARMPAVDLVADLEGPQLDFLGGPLPASAAPLLAPLFADHAPAAIAAPVDISHGAGRTAALALAMPDVAAVVADALGPVGPVNVIDQMLDGLASAGANPLATLAPVFAGESGAGAVSLAMPIDPLLAQAEAAALAV